jgi:hypothetical protein
LTVWRPWVLVVEATEPSTTRSSRHHWEKIVDDAGYDFCLFDGLSCFYVAKERQDLLGQSLSYPACVLDDYSTLAFRRAIEETREAASSRQGFLESELARWRNQALAQWATAVSMRAGGSQTSRDVDGLRQENARLAEDNQVLAQEAASLRQWIADMYQSTSWKVTKPLRAARSASKMIRRR